VQAVFRGLVGGFRVARERCSVGLLDVGGFRLRALFPALENRSVSRRGWWLGDGTGDANVTFPLPREKYSVPCGGAAGG
jgi:hypothetical protein